MSRTIGVCDLGKFCTLVATFWLCCLPVVSGAQSIAESDIVLTLEVVDAGGTQISQIDLDMHVLQARPAVTFETHTKWTDGPQVFKGVRLYDWLQELDIHDGEMMLTATNDFKMTFPVNEVRRDGAIIAYERNGRAMTRRDYGPLWLVFNYDSGPRYQTEKAYARSVWQLRHISVTQ